LRNEDLPELRVDSEVVVKSIGYQTTPIEGVPFDKRKHTIPHHFGCVVDPEQDNKELIGLYVAGWAKRGPIGIIDATLRDTKETFGIIKHHLETKQLQPKSTSIDEV
jgi:NADPH-dependent glutamate synthase beta subunit-like oxidoreductase